MKKKTYIITLEGCDDETVFEMDLTEEEKIALANKWVKDTIESFSRRRTGIAPIDEPCEGWLTDLIYLLDYANRSMF